MRGRRSSGRLRAASGSCFCPISIWAATPALRWGFRWTRWWCGIRGRLQGGQTTRSAGGEPHSAVEGPLRGASALSAEPCGRGAREVSGHSGDRASGVPLGGLPEGRCAGLDRAADRDCGAGAGGIDVCHRHGDSPGEPAGAAICSRKASGSSRSTITAACAPRCIASARSIWRGRWKIWSKAAW